MDGTKTLRSPVELLEFDVRWIRHTVDDHIRAGFMLDPGDFKKIQHLLSRPTTPGYLDQGEKLYLKHWGEMVYRIGTKEQVLAYEIYLTQEKDHGR